MAGIWEHAFGYRHVCRISDYPGYCSCGWGAHLGDDCTDRAGSRQSSHARDPVLRANHRTSCNLHQATDEFADTTIYTWFKGTAPNGTPISSGTTGNPGGCPSTYTISSSSNSNDDTLTITQACLLDAGNYYAVATNTIYDDEPTDTGYNVMVSATSNTLPIAVNWGETDNITTAGNPPEAADQTYDAMSMVLPNGQFWLAGGENYASGLQSNTFVYTPGPGVWGTPTVLAGDTPTNTGTWAPGATRIFAAGPHLDGTATLFSSNRRRIPS